MTADQQGPAGSSIYDLGYRGYEGPRLGRRSAIGALVAHSWRTAYGLGRRARSKVAPVFLTLAAILPSLLGLGMVALFAQFGEAGEAFEAINPIGYDTLFSFVAILVFLFCAFQAPELFGRDQQLGVLSLYFTRAVSRFDYAFARALGLFLALAVIVLSPYALLVMGRLLVAPDLADGLADELPGLPAVLGICFSVIVVVGSIAAATASLTPRRIYATVAIIAIFIIPNIAAVVLTELETGLLGQIAVLLSPADVLDGINAALFDTRPENIPDAGIEQWLYFAAGAAWVAGAWAVLLNRYRAMAL